MDPANKGRTTKKLQSSFVSVIVVVIVVDSSMVVHVHVYDHVDDHEKTRPTILTYPANKRP